MTESCDLDEGDILPCPFCGNPPKVEMTGFHLGGRTIRCDADDCMGPHTTAACVNDAVAQWNKRTGDDAHPVTPVEPEREGWHRELIDREPDHGQYGNAVTGDVAQPAPKYDLRAFARFLYEHCALDPDRAGDVAATILSEYTVWPDDFASQPPAAPVETILPGAEHPENYRKAFSPCSAGSADIDQGTVARRLRGLVSRMEYRVEVMEERDGKEGAVTGPGIGIGYLLARDLTRVMAEAAAYIENHPRAEPQGVRK